MARGAALAVAVLILAGLLGGCVQTPPAPKGSPASGEVDGASAAVATATPPASKIAPPTDGAYLGVYVPPAPFDLGELDRYESQAGRPVSILMWYQPWQEGDRNKLDAGTMVSVWRRGMVPMITWEPWGPGTNPKMLLRPADQPAYRLRNIIEGRYDAYIRTWAAQIRDLGGPVMLRPMHEMNGTWYPWGGVANGNSPAEFAAAWRHIHDIFEAEHATNVTWVWSINVESVPRSAENTYSAYYPGDRYVDWTAISGFNFGTSADWSSWRTFDDWYQSPLRYLSRLGKPVCIAEIGCVEKGGDKAAWLADAYQSISAEPRIKAVVYYDASEVGRSSSQDWRITTTPKSLSAYRAAIAPSYFRSNIPAELSQWARALQLREWQHLTSIDPLY
jgi:beta-mannanase